MPRGLVIAENPTNVAKMRGINGGRGLVRNERIRKRFIRESEITLRTFWAPLSGAAVSVSVTYPIVGGGFDPA